MTGWLSRFFARLFARGEPALSDATPRDAAALADIHAASFRHGWSDGEFTRFLMERNVVAQRATLGRSQVGFIISRIGGGEAHRAGGEEAGEEEVFHLVGFAFLLSHFKKISFRCQYMGGFLHRYGSCLDHLGISK